MYQKKRLWSYDLVALYKSVYCYYFLPQVVKIPELKTKKAKIKMSDGNRSGRSTGRVSCKSTELKRCSMIEMRWNKYEVSLTSHVVINIRAFTAIPAERQ